MSRRTDAERIAVALTHIATLHRHLSRGDLNDQIVVDAVSMRLSAAIEAVQGDGSSLGKRLLTRDGQISVRRAQHDQDGT